MINKNIRAVLDLGDGNSWYTVDEAAGVCYFFAFIISRFKGDKEIESVSIDANSIISFEWTNEANCLYLTGKIKISDADNLMMRYFNTYSVLYVYCEKRKYTPKKSPGDLIEKFSHAFIFDKIRILKQLTGQSVSTDAILYEISLKSWHLLKLQTHVPFSNWDSELLTAGNYEVGKEDEPDDLDSGSGIAGALGKKVKQAAEKLASDVASKIRCSSVISKLQEFTKKVNTITEKFGLASPSSEAPVKIYSIIKTVLNKALETENDEQKIEVDEKSFDEVFDDAQHPMMKYCATGKDTVLDIVKYLQQKLFSLKLPKRITSTSDLGLTYISYDEFNSKYRVVNFKNIDSFILNKADEANIDYVQLNGGARIVEHVRELKIKLLPPEWNKFVGTVEYISNFYNDADYMLKEMNHPGVIEEKKNFTFQVAVAENTVDLASGLTKVKHDSNKKLKFMRYADDFDDLNAGKETEQNIKSIGEDIFGKLDATTLPLYTNVYSEDFDNQSYIKVLESTLNKNVIIVKSTGKYFSVPGMLYKLNFDEAAATNEKYYTQLKDIIMHVTKVVHKFEKAPGTYNARHFVGEELTMCKI